MVEVRIEVNLWRLTYQRVVDVRREWWTSGESGGSQDRAVEVNLSESGGRQERAVEVRIELWRLTYQRVVDVRRERWKSG